MAKMRTDPGPENEFEALRVLRDDLPTTISLKYIFWMVEEGWVLEKFEDDRFDLTLKGHWHLFKYKLTKV
jgi:hypothetical protein